MAPGRDGTAGDAGYLCRVVQRSRAASGESMGVTGGGVPVPAHALARALAVATKRSPSSRPHGVSVGVWPAFGISANVARGNCRATWRPAELGVLASRSPERTSTGASGIVARGVALVRVAGHSMQVSVASKPALVHAAGENGRNARQPIAARVCSYAARRAPGRSASENVRG